MSVKQAETVASSSQNDSFDELSKESDIRMLEILAVRSVSSSSTKTREVFSESDILSIQDSLRQYLNLHLNPSAKPEFSLSQKLTSSNVHREQELIEECLMFMTGLKSNILFKRNEKGEFEPSPKYRLAYLNKEIAECVAKITYYGQIVSRIEEFIEKNAVNYNNSTQTYEAFNECLIEYLRYYKATLNEIAIILEKKERAFTLVDFLNHIRECYFPYLDILFECLKQIERDREKQANEKSINLLSIIYQYLITRLQGGEQDRVAKFLLWLFARTITPFLTLIDSFIQEGVLFDSRHELGFKRNSAVDIASLDYLKCGFDVLLPAKFSPSLPRFMNIILACSFKICKYMEVVKHLENVNRHADIYEGFLVRIRDLCPSLIVEVEKKEKSLVIYKKETSTFLDINFNNLKQVCDKVREPKVKYSIARIEAILENNASTNNKSHLDFMNIEEKLEKIILDCYLKYVNYSASVLITNLLDTYHLRQFFPFLQSYFLFKSNEVMFLFSKSLFDLVKRLETYQDDAILNSLLFHSMNTVTTTDAQAKKSAFSDASRLVSMHYDLAMDEKHRANMNKICDIDGMTRLIGAIQLKVKVSWPLNIVISQANLDAYNRVFLFMMQLKQVKYDLDSLRLQDMDLTNYKDKSQTAIDQGSVKKMFYLRFKLMNFMNNAHDLICNQIYEITDEFLEKLEHKRDIDQIVELHERFLAKLVKNSLVSVSAFQNSFMRIFISVLEFCDLWRRGVSFFTLRNQLYVDSVEKSVEENFAFTHTLMSQVSHKIESTYFQILISALK